LCIATSASVRVCGPRRCSIRMVFKGVARGVELRNSQQHWNGLQHTWYIHASRFFNIDTNPMHTLVSARLATLERTTAEKSCVELDVECLQSLIRIRALRSGPNCHTLSRWPNGVASVIAARSTVVGLASQTCHSRSKRTIKSVVWVRRRPARTTISRRIVKVAFQYYTTRRRVVVETDVTLIAIPT
jgi:hypothetical protein